MKRMILMSALLAAGAVASPELPQHGVVMEFWDEVKGVPLSTMLEASAKRPPTAVYIRETIDDHNFGADQFGARYSALLVPPATGQYTFYLAADDRAEMLLSTDESAANLKKVCDVQRYMPRHRFVSGRSSGKVRLEQGKKYYLVVNYKEVVNDDHVSLAWEGPGINSKRVIATEYLEPKASPAVLKIWESTAAREQRTNELVAQMLKQPPKRIMPWLNKLPRPDLRLLETELMKVEGAMQGKSDAERQSLLKPYLRAASGVEATPEKPVDNIVGKRLLYLEEAWLQSLSDKQLLKLGPHRLAKSLGDIPPKAKRVKSPVTLSSRGDKWTPELVSTGRYALPGKRVTVEIPAELVGKNLELQVGHHFPPKNNRLVSMPNTSRSFKLNEATTTFVTPHGGLMLLRVPKNVELKNASFTIRGAILAPRFELGKDTDADWEKLKKNPAPWGELVCEHLVLLASREALQEVTNPTALMTWWNENNRDMEDFFAFYPGIPFRMHAGHYAAEGVSYWPLQWGANNMGNQLNLNRLKERNSPLFLHEHGHHCDFWDMELSFWAESTTNWGGYYLKARKGKAFTWKDSHDTHLQRLFNPQDKGMQEIMQDKWYKIASKGTHHWSYPVTSMMIGYADDFGWEAVKATIKRLRNKEDVMYQWPFVKGADADQAKIDRYLIGLSEAAGRDVRPYFAHFKMFPSAGAARLLDELKLPKWDKTHLVQPAVCETRKNKALTIPSSADKLLSFAKDSKITWRASTAAGGSVKTHGNGDAVYTPKHDFTGQDTLTYELSNEYGKTVEKELQIIVK